ncbi:hemolysin [Peptoniphilus lacrimalis DNF00528]|nr:hemolysin [Peptoniphilus lacrimalis DNF00528]
MDEGAALWAKLILIVFLTMVNAFFASAEMAMVSANKNKIKELAEKGNKRAKTLLETLKNSTRFLSTIQVAITLAGFFSSGSAAISISRVFGDYLREINIPYGTTISFIVVTLILSYISLVFGELVPKRIALYNAENVALRGVYAVKITSIIFAPFVKLLSISTVLVLKLLGKYSEDVEEQISEEELKSYIKVSQEQGVINSTGEDMIINIMDFDDKMAYEIMTPRTAIFMVDYDEFSVDSISEILATGYSRMPVYRENADNIIGIINIKDLFIEYEKNNYKNFNLDKCLKTPYFVPETKKIDRLLKELQTSKNYVAILIDEYGGFSGMVTVEDIVEEIVGEIEDEYDRNTPSMEKIGPNEYMVDGYMTIEDINEELDTKLFSENHETISGLIIEKLGYIPEENEKKKLQVKTNGVMLTVLAIKDKRIVKAALKILDNKK